ncbi:MAG: hypothetical protein AAF799_34295 [Myxococcota bacterium]
MLVAAVAVALLLAPAAPNPVDAPESAASKPEAGRISIEVVGADAAAVGAAVGVRLRGFEVVEEPGPRGFAVRIVVAEDGSAVVDVRRGADRWTRELRDLTGDLEQEVATATANLVTTLSYEGVPEPPAAEPEPEPELVPTEPEPEPTAELEPEPTEPEAEPPDERPPWGITVTTAPVVHLELLDRRPTIVSGIGGQLGAQLRHDSGAVLHAALRASGRDYTRGIGLLRLRVALGAGYVHAVGPWRLGVVGALTAEPWWPLRGGRRIDVQRNATLVRPAPMLGGVLRLVAGRLFGREGAPVRARLGPLLEVSGSASPDGGVPELQVAGTRGETTSLGHFGGLEIALGVELGLEIIRP